MNVVQKMIKKMKDKYLEFYKTNFGTAKYCTKSWGLASFEAGAQSRQVEIAGLQKKIDEALKELELIDFFRTGNSDKAINILKGNKK